MFEDMMRTDSGATDNTTTTAISGVMASYKDRTEEASKKVREKARLLWVPVASKVNVDEFHEMATRRWQENVVPVADFEALAKPAAVVKHLLADICPSTLE